MTRTLIATATALIAVGTLLSPAAQACISCEYVPEVVRPHATSPLAYGRGDNAVSHGSSGGYSVKRRVAKGESVAKSVKAAKIEKQDKPAKVAKVEKEDKPAKIAKAAKPAKTETEKVAKAAPVETTPAESENSAITVATADAAAAKEAPVAKAETAAKPTDCKKFFASVGMTLTVPCEQ